ncbi:hypothetical protein QVD17_37865 [Tagetes erecta]|uniref:Uncharacterized protein n=1 Tax=Tagetes erecta TaxID=13708 RepID=A0AAD8NJL4_TARER|nr:hypothetical protein QVD17_37865 [Tagetes erecta]
MEEGRVMSIFDALVIKEGARDNLLALANLAMRCLNLNGKYRPTMKEVATELETLRRCHIPSTTQSDIRPIVYAEELPMLTYGGSSSTFLSFNDSISQYGDLLVARGSLMVTVIPEFVSSPECGYVACLPSDYEEL